ncbi:MAG: 6-phosphogluconolactonase [Pontixanthobacter sp.]
MDNLTIIENADDAQIADWLEGALSEALAATKGPIAISVPGGSTPFPILKRLTQSPIDWSRINVWPGDDRMIDDRIVPEDHEASNTGKIRALLEPAGATVMSLSIMEKVPPFALVWLGMGEDGHIASLFPSANPQADDDRRMRRLTPDPLPPEAPFDRITLTLPALLDSDRLVFVIRGGEKRAVFDAASRNENDLPIARLLGAARQPVICFA